MKKLSDADALHAKMTATPGEPAPKTATVSGQLNEVMQFDETKSVKKPKSAAAMLNEVLQFSAKKDEERKAVTEAEIAKLVVNGTDAIIDIFFDGADEAWINSVVKPSLDTVLENIKNIKDEDIKLLAVNQLQLALIS